MVIFKYFFGFLFHLHRFVALFFLPPASCVYMNMCVESHRTIRLRSMLTFKALHQAMAGKKKYSAISFFMFFAYKHEQILICQIYRTKYEQFLCHRVAFDFHAFSFSSHFFSFPFMCVCICLEAHQRCVVNARIACVFFSIFFYPFYHPRICMNVNICEKYFFVNKIR